MYKEEMYLFDIFAWKSTFVIVHENLKNISWRSMEEVIVIIWMRKRVIREGLGIAIN